MGLLLVGCGQATGRPASTGRTAAVASPFATPSPSATPTVTWAPWHVPGGSSLVVTAARRSVPVFTAPGGAVRWRLTLPNALGAPLVFLVRTQSPGWFSVDVPVRPNGAAGWVRAADVTVSIDPYALSVSQSAHRLTVYRDGRPTARYPVAVGRADAPTPDGTFYLTELLRFTSPTAYSPVAFGLSAFSDAYSEFEGGPGQIGLHGTTEPWTIGQSASHGCIRMYDDDVQKLAALVPAGTPITVTP